MFSTRFIGYGPCLAVYKLTSRPKNYQQISAQRLYLPQSEFGDLILPTSTNLHNNNNEIVNERCEVIHVGLVCSGYKTVLFLHVMLKSIFFYRHNPIHFHIVSNKVSENVLKTLFDSWAVPLVNVTFYNVTETLSDIRWVPNSHYSGIFGLLKLTFPKLIHSTPKIIVLDTDLTFTSDILELWRFFKLFGHKQIVGIVENQSDFYLNKKSKPWPALGRGFNTGVMLYDLVKMRGVQWDKLWTDVAKRTAIVYGATRLGDQDIINSVLKLNPHLVYRVPCQFNSQLSDHTNSFKCYLNREIKVVHWNSPKKQNVINQHGAYFRTIYKTFLELNGNLLKRQLFDCSDNPKNFTEVPADVCAEFRRAQTHKWRTLLFFREFKYAPTRDDVTFVAQTSFERLHMVEELSKFWEGPISITLYVTDPEFQACQRYIETSEILQDRYNIAYHIVFRDGEYYPINILRNVGLKNIVTPYIFAADIDFLPMQGLYQVLKNYLSTVDMRKKALVVPAFETQKYKSRIPKSKKELVEMWENREVFTFRSDVWASGHAPTNYKKWKGAKLPYTVGWEPDFEPYIVVKSDVTEYDPRFMGFGWNKVSHIMELEAQAYDFLVLPNAFVIHKPHAPSYDINKFRSSPVYRMCLQNLKEEFISDLVKKYGRGFHTKNNSILTDNAQ